jgi:Ca2+-binding EF-hand superfamily protein
MFDLDEDGVISKAEMLAIVDSIYRMIGDTEKLQEDEKTPLERVEKIFKVMDLDGDGYLSLEEFVKGGEGDSVVLNALHLYSGLM